MMNDVGGAISDVLLHKSSWKKAQTAASALRSPPARRPLPRPSAALLSPTEVVERPKELTWSRACIENLEEEGPASRSYDQPVAGGKDAAYRREGER